jgi:glutaminyl-peptide cyclotransferase
LAIRSRPSASLRFLALVLVLAVSPTGCRSGPAEFDGNRALAHVIAQCEIGPRPVGSAEGQRTADYILAQLRRLGWTAETQNFSYRGVAARNIVASRGRGPIVILGAHYDTRSRADRDLTDPSQPVLGANDGASGVAVLLELARTLDLQQAAAEIWLAFFDAEDQGGIDGWPFSVGAYYMADHLSVQPQAVVIVDMVGDKNQQIFWEMQSDAYLLRKLWAIAADLGSESQFIPRNGLAIMDDHVPFIQKGFTAIDIIGFPYAYWHTSLDTPDKVSADSLERVGRVLEKWIEDGI